MQANKSPSIDCRRKNHLLAALCLAMTGLFTLMGLAAGGRDSQRVSEIKLSVEDPRPVVKAIETLESKYGWVITYEDPRYANDSEIADTNLKIRKDPDNSKSSEITKVLVPRGGALEFTYDVASDTNLPADPAMVVQKLLDAQAAAVFIWIISHRAHRGHRGHNDFSVPSVRSVANNLHTFENWHRDHAHCLTPMGRA